LWDVGRIVIDFFNGCPGFNIGGAGRVGGFIVASISSVVSAAVASVVVSVVPVSGAPVVGIAGVVVSPWWMLAFLAPSLGPAVRLVMPHLVAIVTFNIVHITSLLVVCGKGFVWAVLALIANAVVILIGDELDDSVSCYWRAHLVSCSVNRMDDRSEGRGK
jgi:hypothetical protein